MLELPQAYLHLIQRIFAQYIPNQIVLAYGSRVTGLAHKGSDIDLVVINPQNADQPQNRMTELRTALSESDLPILVDIHDWAKIPVQFREIILNRYVLVFGDPHFVPKLS